MSDLERLTNAVELLFRAKGAVPNIQTVGVYVDVLADCELEQALAAIDEATKDESTYVAPAGRIRRTALRASHDAANERNKEWRANLQGGARNASTAEIWAQAKAQYDTKGFREMRQACNQAVARAHAEGRSDVPWFAEGIEKGINYGQNDSLGEATSIPEPWRSLIADV